jgi:hypothetical protein
LSGQNKPISLGTSYSLDVAIWRVGVSALRTVAQLILAIDPITFLFKKGNKLPQTAIE